MVRELPGTSNLRFRISFFEMQRPLLKRFARSFKKFCAIGKNYLTTPSSGDEALA